MILLVETKLFTKITCKRVRNKQDLIIIYKIFPIGIPFASGILEFPDMFIFQSSATYRLKVKKNFFSQSVILLTRHLGSFRG